MKTDLTFFTNEEGHTLFDRFKSTLKDTRCFDVLVGYFRVSGFYQLSDSLKSIGKTRILVGLGVDEDSYRAINEYHSQTVLDFESHNRAKKQFQDRIDIFDSLDDAAVDRTKVSLVCIREELEAWLLADKRALQIVLGKMRHYHPLGPIKRYKHPDSIPQPKTKLIQLFQRELGKTRKYVDFRDAKRIVAAIPDFNQIRRSTSFQRFHDIVAGL